MKTYLRALVTLAVLFLTSSPVWAHHISGFIYCDENRSGVIDAGDRPLDGVEVKITSLTAVPNQMFLDISGDAVPFSPVPGFYYMALPTRTEDYRDELTGSGLPLASTVIFPAAGFYPNLQIITCSGCPTNKKEDIDFLVDGCQLPACGNGVTDIGETCDPPGSAQSHEQLCRLDCTYCGDGVTDNGEECDDGANNSDSTPGACRTDCTPPVCGDGVTDPGETCDPPGSTQSHEQLCRQDCTYCGDGVTDSGEECDAGANNSDSTPGACRTDCTPPACGDGVTDPGEGCDDGNLVDGDRCTATCTIEFCGDGIIQPGLGEQCEPPSSLGCDANCHAAEICTDLVDNDGDGQIDCLDSDCNCLPIGRDPGAIRFGPVGAGDLIAVHGSLDPATKINPATEVISFRLTNANGKVFQLTIPAGDIKQTGRNRYHFHNRLAQQARSGLARFDLRYFPKEDNFTFVLKAYGDLSLATEANMAIQVVVGDDPFLNQATWIKLPQGWILTLPGE